MIFDEFPLGGGPTIFLFVSFFLGITWIWWGIPEDFVLVKYLLMDFLGFSYVFLVRTRGSEHPFISEHCSARSERSWPLGTLFVHSTGHVQLGQSEGRCIANRYWHMAMA